MAFTYNTWGPTCMLILTIIIKNIDNTAAANDFEKVVSFNSTGLSLDPSQWTDLVKTRIYQSGIAAGYAAFLGASLPFCIGWFVLHYCLVKLDWALVFLSSAALYGYRRGAKLVMVGASLAFYAYAFGALTL